MEYELNDVNRRRREATPLHAASPLVEPWASGSAAPTKKRPAVSDQLALVGPATPPDLKLTARQRFALEFIAQKPCSSEELGAALHEYRGTHAATTLCRWCQPEGAGMGSRLRDDGLVKFRRKLGVWYLVEHGAPKPQRGSQSDDIPF